MRPSWETRGCGDLCYLLVTQLGSRAAKRWDSILSAPTEEASVQLLAIYRPFHSQSAWVQIPAHTHWQGAL